MSSTKNARLTVASVAVLAGTAGDKVGRVKAVIDREYAGLEKFYKTAHAAPELGLEVPATAKRVAGEFRTAGFEVTEKVGGHGVVGVMRNGPGKTLLVRTDMDALPILEETGAEYASKALAVDGEGNKVPAMHACGHDMHMTSVVGLGKAMAAMKDAWTGTLVVIGQPGEEVLQGAKAMLEDGLFERFPRPDFCLAQHVDCTLETGKMGYVSKYAWANIDNAEVVIRGFGGHGAAPHLTKDPIVLAAQTVLALQTIASREVFPLDSVVVTVGAIHGGTKPNIIPEEVKLQLTIRTYKDDVRVQAKKAVERIIKGQAMAAGMPAEREPVITWTKENCPATYNHPALVEQVMGAMRKAIGEENVVPRDATMGGEDFGMYGRTQPAVPIFMMKLGSIEPEKVAASKKGGPRLPGVHSPFYLPEREATIRMGVLGMTVGALELLAK